MNIIWILQILIKMKQLISQFLIKGWFRNISCLLTLLSYSQSRKIADVYLVLIHCWAIPNPKTLLTYTLSCYIAELFPSLKHCADILYLVMLLKCSQSWNTDDVNSVLLHCWAVSNLIILLGNILSIAELFLIL